MTPRTTNILYFLLLLLITIAIIVLTSPLSE